MFRLSRVWPSAAALGLSVCFALPAQAGIELISKLPPRYISDTGTAPSTAQAISANGRYVAFVSDATNLVPGQVDTNVGSDVFVYDRMTGTTELVSRSADSPTTAGNGPSLEVSLSGNGRFVVFSSLATDLADLASDGNGVSDVFVHDRVTGRTDLVSHAHFSQSSVGNGRSLQPEISADGRFLAFYSEARNLVQKPGRHFGNVFLYDRGAGTAELVSLGTGPAQAGLTASFFPAINANGRFVAFLSYAKDLVPGQRDAGVDAPDVFLYDRAAKKTTLVSHAASSPTVASNGFSSRRPAISADGSTVVFDSSGGNLVPNQRNPGGGQHIFLYHRPTGTTSLVNHASSSLTTRGNGATGPYAVSADGSFVAFTSFARNLVAGQADRPGRTSDVFLYQRGSGRITLLSGAGGSATVTANASSSVRGLSADGDLVLFQSDATDLAGGVADGNGGADVFLHDRRTRKTVLVSHDAASASRTGNRASLGSVLSADGKWVAFESAATDLVSDAQDLNEGADVFLDGGAAGRELVSRRAPDLPSEAAQAASRADSIDASGRFVVFTSNSSFLVDGQADPNGGPDVFLRDRVLGTNVLVSRSAANPKTAGNAPSGGDTCYARFSSPRISADGRFVVFASCATDLVSAPGGPVAPDENDDLFLYDRETGGMTRIGGPSLVVSAISSDGSFVLFREPAGGEFSTLYLYDRAAGTSTRIYGPDRVVAASLSADGRFAAFHFWRGGFSTPTTDYVLYDRVTGTLKGINNAGGGPLTISADGRFVAFRSTSTALVPGQVDDPGTVDVFLYDRVSETYTLVTHAPGSAVTATGGHGAYGELDLSADGRFLAFASGGDIFLFDRETGAITKVNPETGDSWANPEISADGRIVAFTDRAEPPLRKVLRYDRATGALVTVTERGASGAFLSADGSVLAFTRAVSSLSDSTDAFVYIP